MSWTDEIEQEHELGFWRATWRGHGSSMYILSGIDRVLTRRQALRILRSRLRRIKGWHLRWSLPADAAAMMGMCRGTIEALNGGTRA